MAPVNVLNMTALETEQFIGSFDYVLSDCDGVIWHSAKPYPGSGKFFETLQKLGKKVFYVSNNNLRTMESFKLKFDACGINNGNENLIVPTEAIGDYLKSVNFNKKVFCISSQTSMETLESYGFVCKQGPSVGPEDFMEYVKYMKDDPEIGAVVLDFDYHVNLPKLYMASAYLKRPEVHFISGLTDKLIPITKEVNVLGGGQFCDMIADFTGRKPVVLAKPGKEFAKYLIKRTGITDPNRVLFIGDMLEQDIGMGKVAGFQTLLVLTTNSKQEMDEEENYVPDFYTTSLGDIVPLLQANL